MAAFLNNCRFIPAAGGTTDWVYSSAVGGSQSPALAGAVDGRKYKFLGISSDLTQWEIAEGAYIASSGTFARTTVLYNSSGTGSATGQSGAGTKINFTTAPNVAIVGIKEDLVSVEEANSFTASQRARARANIDALKKNYVVNGAMMFSQEKGATASTTNAAYIVDQWLLDLSATTGAISIAQVASATPLGSSNRLRATVTAAQTTIGSSYCIIRQPLEGLRIADLLAGTASAKPIVARFGVKAPAGTYQVGFPCGDFTTTVNGTFTISAGEANTDVYKEVTLATPASGNYLTSNAAGAHIQIVLAQAGQFNLFGTNGNVFELFDVGLYEGDIAPTFQLPDPITELMLCQRYYETVGGASGTPLGAGFIYNTTLSFNYVPFKVPKRVAPSFAAAGSASDYSVYRAGGNNAIDTLPTMDAANIHGANVRFTHSTAPFTAGQGCMAYAFTATAMLRFNARM